MPPCRSCSEVNDFGREMSWSAIKVGRDSPVLAKIGKEMNNSSQPAKLYVAPILVESMMFGGHQKQNGHRADVNCDQENGLDSR